MTLAMEDPNFNVDSELLKTTESIFLYIYTIEAALKIGALGFIRGNGAYLKES